MIFDGRGVFTTSTQAEGTATWKWHCGSVSKNNCGTAGTAPGDLQATLDVDGSVPWTMTFTP